MHVLRTVCLIVLALAVRADDVIQIEGEDRVREGGPGSLRVLERDGAFGGRVLSYWDDHGTWAEWRVQLPDSGSYALSFRYAAVADTERHLLIDGRVPPGFPDSIRFPPTGHYGRFDLHTVADGEGHPRLVELPAGTYVLRLTNEASIGLALDAILLHRPGLRVTDQPLPRSEASARESSLPLVPAAPVATAGRLIKGMVAATFATDGLVSLAVADTLFSLGDEKGESSVFQTRNLLVHRQTRASGRRFLVTDGKAAFMVFTPGVDFHLSPLAYRAEGRLIYPATWRLGDGQVYIPALGIAGDADASWMIGAACISAVPALVPRQGDNALRFAEEARVAALKIAPASWNESGMQIDLSREGHVDILRSSTEALPGIAAFHGYTDFEVHFAWDGERLVICELVDLASGERIALL